MTRNDNAVRAASEHLAEFRWHRKAGSTHITVTRDLLLLERTAALMLARTVADMRDAEFTWREIGELLGITEAAARHRYCVPPK